MKTVRTALLFFAPLFLTFLLHFYLFDYEVRGYHVWRQTQTQTVIYNFSFSDNNILNPQRFDLSSGTTTLLYEFPLYQWLIAQVNNLLGYSVAHTRVVSLLFFYFMLAGFYLLMRHFVTQKVALLANVCICFSPVLYYYCVNPLPDILALAFGVWSLHFFFKFLKSDSHLHFVLFSLSVLLATLVKLPYIMFGTPFILYCYYKFNEADTIRTEKRFFLFCGLLIPAGIWYWRASDTWGTNLVGQGISANKKGLLDLLDYLQSNLISSMPELITNYAACAFLFYGFYLFFKSRRWEHPQYRYLVFAFLFCCFYFFYEMNMIERTHDYYLIPFVPFIFLVVAFGISRMLHTRYRRAVFVLVCLTPLMAYLRINHRWNEHPGFNENFSLLASDIKEVIPEQDTCIVDHDESRYIALYYLKRRGFTLTGDHLNRTNLDSLYSSGGRYLVTINRNFDTLNFPQTNFRLLLDKEIRVYALSKR